MRAYLALFWDILRFRRGPQHVPPSQSLPWLLAGLVFAAGFAEGTLVFGPLRNLGYNAFDLALLLLFSHYLLRLAGRRPRFPQTFSALCGTALLLRLAYLPAGVITADPSRANDDGLVLAAVFYILVLFIYSILVMGHILRHALSTSWLAGTLLALVYHIGNIFLLELVFAVRSG